MEGGVGVQLPTIFDTLADAVRVEEMTSRTLGARGTTVISFRTADQAQVPFVPKCMRSDYTLPSQHHLLFHYSRAI